MIRDKELTKRANRIAKHAVKRWVDEDSDTIIDVVEKLPHIVVKSVRRGRTNLTRKEKVTIPVWTYRKYGKHFFRYYVLHEVAHVIQQLSGRIENHSERFHSIEKSLCDEWGLSLSLAGAYPRKIEYKKQVVYTKNR